MGKDKKLCADVPRADLHILYFVNNWEQKQTYLRSFATSTRLIPKRWMEAPPLNRQAILLKVGLHGLHFSWLILIYFIDNQYIT